MKNLIIGDIRRILCKKSMWLAFVIAIAAIVGIVMYALSFMKDSSFVFATSVISGIVDLGAIIIGVAVFLAVYGDDFKSMSIISIIGRGNSRRKLIISKFINSVILSALLYLVLSAVVFAFSIFMEMELLPDEALAMYLGVFKGFYLTVNHGGNRNLCDGEHTVFGVYSGVVLYDPTDGAVLNFAASRSEKLAS